MKLLGLLFYMFLIQVCLGIDLSNIASGSIFLRSKNTILHRILKPIGSTSNDKLFIVNGKLATAGQFPYQIGIDIARGSSHSFCGGTLLTKSFALTAAHCVNKCETVTVLVGALDLTNPDDPTGQVMISVPCNQVIVHPEYSTNTYYNDLAIIDLGEEVQLSNTIGVVKLPSSPSSQTGAEGIFTVSGWGKTSDASDPVSAQLSYIQVPLLNASSCKNWFLNNAGYVINGKQICTDTSSGQSTCRGDSGGPVVTQNDDGSFTQVGIISLGLDSCEEAGAPNIHTDVYSFVPFITANTDYIN